MNQRGLLALVNTNSSGLVNIHFVSGKVGRNDAEFQYELLLLLTLRWKKKKKWGCVLEA